MKRLAAHRTHYFSMTYLWFTLPILIFLNKNIPIIIICLACISSFLEQWQHHMCLKILLNWGFFLKWDNLTFMTHFFLANLLFIYFIYLLKCFAFRNKFSWKDKNQNTKKGRQKKTKNKTPQTTTTTKKWINLDYVQKFNKKWKLEKCWFFF